MFLPYVGSNGLWGDQPRSAGVTAPNTPWSCIDYIPDINDTSSWDIVALEGMYTGCHIPTLIEEYRALPLLFRTRSPLMRHAVTTRWFGQNLAMHNDSSNTKRDSSSQSGQVTLSELEAALASATAMTMWSAARASTLQLTQIINTGDEGVSPISGLPVTPSPLVAFSTIVTPVNGTASVTQQKLVGRLTVSFYTL